MLFTAFFPAFALERIEVFPERFVLFKHLFLGYRQLESEKEIGEGIAVQDVVAVKHVALTLKIDAEFVCPEAVKNFVFAVKTADFTGGLQELFRFQAADLIDQSELSEDVQFIELSDALFTEIELKHGGSGFSGKVQVRCAWI
jgi:hypothetical protein